MMRVVALLSVGLTLLATPPSKAQQQKAAASSTLKKPSSPQSKLPNVFLITIDTLRADHIHCYGYEPIETPTLDALAKDGIRFEQAFTPSPVTNTSHTSIMTGLLPSSHGVTDFAVPLSETHVTLAQLLKSKGYSTSAFIGAVILDSKSLAPGLDRGFDFYDNFPEHADPKSRWGRVERRGTDVVARAERWLNAHPAGPHFTWIHLYDPHDPYEAPSPYAEKYRDRPYDGEIAFADSTLGGFVSYLKKQDWYQGSIIVVVGDHGEGLGEHKEETHGLFLYDSTTHVPLIAKLANNRKGNMTVAAQVRTIDIAPTILALVGITADQPFDGESLQPLLSGESGSSRIAIGETDYPLRFGWAPLRSVRADGFKYIEAPRPELYNLQADAHEVSNIYDEAAGSAAKLSHLLPPNDSVARNNSQTLPDPKDKVAEQNLLHTAMMAADDNRQPEARIAFGKVLQLDPKSAVALQGLGEVEFLASEFAAAAEHLKEARQARPDDSTSAFHEGQARLTMGDFAGARDALEASLKAAPNQLSARLLLGDVYIGLKNYDAAKDQFEAAQLLEPASAAAHVGLARVQIFGLRFAEALQELEPLSKSKPDDEQIFDLLARAYRGLGKVEQAQAASAKADQLRARSQSR